MFLGGIPRRPDKETAYRQLRKHLTMVGAWLAIIRVTPYVLHYLSDSKEELKLEF